MTNAIAEYETQVNAMASYQYLIAFIFRMDGPRKHDNDVLVFFSAVKDFANFKSD